MINTNTLCIFMNLIIAIKKIMCLCPQNDDLLIKILVQYLAQKKKFKSDSNNLIDRLYITMAMGHANFCEYFHVEVTNHHGNGYWKFCGAHRVRQNIFYLDKRYEFHVTVFTCQPCLFMLICSESKNLR